VLQCVTVCCSVLQCVAVHQYVIHTSLHPVCVCVLQYVAVCCVVLRRVAVPHYKIHTLLQPVCVCVCCRILRCVGACCDALYAAAAIRRLLKIIGLFCRISSFL